MKKSLFATALLVALVGCSQNDDTTMGTAAPAESGANASTEIRQESTLTNDASGISGSGSVESGNSGAAAGSIQSPGIASDPAQNNPAAGGTVSGSVTTTPDQPAQPAQPPQPDQSQQQSQPSAPNTTGDLSNGDTSNRPAGDPAAQQQQQPQQPQ